MSAAATAAALIFASGALAHGGETSFVVEPTTIAPGGGVAVRADVVAPGPVTLALLGTDGSRIPAGVIDQTDQGHFFDVLITIPVDLPPGHWTIVAEADGTTIGSATLEVAGLPVGLEEGGQGPREEDDALLVPLPSGWQASRSNPPAAATSAIGAIPSDRFDLAPIVALAAAIGVLLLLALRTMVMRRRRIDDRRR